MTTAFVISLLLMLLLIRVIQDQRWELHGVRADNRMLRRTLDALRDLNIELTDKIIDEQDNRRDPADWWKE